MLRIFAGHPKASLVTFQHILGAIAREVGWKVLYRTHIYDIDRLIEDRGTHDLLFYKSASHDTIKRSASKMVGIHVYRDPRDMLISGYFSSKYSHPAEDHPKLQLHRKKLHTVSSEDGIILEMDYLDEYFQDMRGWDFNDKRFLNVPFESLYKTEECAKLMMVTMVTRLLAPIDSPKLDKILEENTFTKLSKGRRVGEENVKHHYRKGTSGDWRNHFTPKVNREFMKRYEDILIHYGYQGEKNDYK